LTAIDNAGLEKSQLKPRGQIEGSPDENGRFLVIDFQWVTCQDRLIQPH
jgi:hypothetical protein